MSQHHSFDIHLAEKYGVHEAILIHHFEHWIRVNKKLNRNFHEGRYWTYQTLDEIAAHFPYFSRSQVFEIIERLCSGKSRRSKKESEFEPVLIKGNFNRTAFDKTTWYAFANQEIFTVLANAKMDISTCQNGYGHLPTPIPDTITDPKTDSSSSSVSSNSKPEDDPAPTKEEEEEIARRLKERNQRKDLPKIVSQKKWAQQVLKDFRLEMEEERRKQAESDALLQTAREEFLSRSAAEKMLILEREMHEEQRLNEIERKNREISAGLEGKMFTYLINGEVLDHFEIFNEEKWMIVKMNKSNQIFRAFYRQDWDHLGDAILSQIIMAKGCYA